MKRKILHVDVNNAFLSWTAVDRLSKGETLDIRTIPSIIGGNEDSRHGIVLAKSPIAKKMGIVTGEPIFFAKKKCSNLQIFKGSFEVYRKYSDELYKLYKEYTSKVQRFSIDECFLDLTDFIPKNKSHLEIGYEINKRVREKFRIYCKCSEWHITSFWLKWLLILKSQIKFILFLKKKFLLKCGLFQYLIYFGVRKKYEC